MVYYEGYMDKQTCLFCNIAQGKAPSRKIWEGADFLAIENKYPIAPIHILVIPKNHVSKNDLIKGETKGFWEGFMQAVVQVIKLKGLDKSGYKLVNNGAGYNHFDHEHMHVLGGTKKEPGGAT